jgi:hypothetical protein
VVRAVLGLGIGSACVRAILLERGEVRWAGEAKYDGWTELADVIAHLAGESGRVVHAARVGVESELVQYRTLIPAPPVPTAAVARYVELEAPRLFRRNGAPLLTDAVVRRSAPDTRALWAVATVEPLVRAVFAGCEQAGIEVECIVPAAEVLSCAVTIPRGTPSLVFPNGGTSEAVETGLDGVWRSRRLRGSYGDSPALAPALERIGPAAGHYAAAFGAANARPRLQFLPTDTRIARAARVRRRLWRGAAGGALAWALAGGLWLARLAAAERRAERELTHWGPALDTALAARRDLTAARSALTTMSQVVAARSRRLSVLAEVTRVLDDSTVLVTVEIGADRSVRVAGYAPTAARVLARLERVRALRDLKLEGPVGRERIANGPEMDRFAIVAHLVEGP